MTFLCRRGRENLRQMTRDTIKINTDGTGRKCNAFSIIKNILPLDEGVRVINTLCEKIITLDFVSGDTFFPCVLIYPYTSSKGSMFYNNFGLKITNVALVIADPLSKEIWAGVPPLM